MSIQQDRLTFFGVLFAVVIVVVGYLQLGRLYPTTGRAQASDASTQVDASPSQSPRDETESLSSEEP